MADKATKVFLADHVFVRVGRIAIYLQSGVETFEVYVCPLFHGLPEQWKDGREELGKLADQDGKG